MGIIDITGRIHDGIWNYGEPFPHYHMRPLPQPEWVETKVYCEIFDGLNSQTGTYLETPAHLLGYEKSYPISQIPIEKLYEMPCTVLQITPNEEYKRPPVTAEMLRKAADEIGFCKEDVRNGALIVSTGWGSHWDSSDYLDRAPYFTYEAAKQLIEWKPFILASDIPRWENLDEPQGFFPEFYAADILMLAPVVNTEQLRLSRSLLTVLPLAVDDSCCVPCRAVVIE